MLACSTRKQSGAESVASMAVSLAGHASPGASEAPSKRARSRVCLGLNASAWAS